MTRQRLLQRLKDSVTNAIPRRVGREYARLSDASHEIESDASEETIAGVLALLAMVAYAFWTVSVRAATVTIAPEMALVITHWTGATIGLLYVLGREGAVEVPVRGAAFALGGGVFLGVGSVAYYIALTYGQTGALTTLTSLYFVVTVLLGYVLLDESLSRRELLGIGFAILSIALMM